MRNGGGGWPDKGKGHAMKKPIRTAGPDTSRSSGPASHWPDAAGPYRHAGGKIDFVDHPSFDQPETERKLFGDGARQIHVPGWISFPEVPEEVEARHGGRTTLRRDEEAGLFLRYNYARYRLSKLAEAQQRRFSAARAKRMELWYERAQKARAELVRANMALVLAMAKKTRISSVDFSDLVSEGNMALLRSVEKFDVSRGFKFSTYACRSILKGFSRLATKTGRYRQRFPTEYGPDMERSDYDVRKHEMQQQDAIESLRDVLARNRAGLTTVEQTVVTERFALASRSKRRTLAEVGKMVGLTNERVRQIQNLALAKIRGAMDDDGFLAA